MRWADAVSRTAAGRAAAGERGAGRRHPADSAMRRACPWSRAARAPACRAARRPTARASCCRWRNSSAFSSIDPLVAAPRSCSRACAIWRSRRRPRSHGLYYAPDPSSQIACTIGGNVAENSGGVHCLKYGLTVHNVRRVRARADHRRRRRIRRRGARCRRLRPARADQRLRRTAGGHHRDHRQAHAQAAAGAGARWRLRRCRKRRATRWRRSSARASSPPGSR